MPSSWKWCWRWVRSIAEAPSTRVMPENSSHTSNVGVAAAERTRTSSNECNVSSGSGRARPGARQLERDDAEVDLSGRGEARRQFGEATGDLGQRGVEPGGQVGDRGHLVQVHPGHGDARGDDVGGDTTQRAGLAVAARAEQGSDTVLGDAFGEIGDEVGAAGQLIGLERPVIRERRDVHR